MKTFELDFTATMNHSPNSQNLRHERHEQCNLLLQSIDKCWQENVIADLTKISIWIRKRLSIESECDRSNNVSREFCC